MKNLTIIAISTLAGGLLVTAGAGIAKAYTEESNTDLFYAGLLGTGAGLILSACGILVRRVYQACAKEEMSLAISSSDAESSDGDGDARYHLKNLLDAWKSQDEEAFLADDRSTTMFYQTFRRPTQTQATFTQESI